MKAACIELYSSVELQVEFLSYYCLELLTDKELSKGKTANVVG